MKRSELNPLPDYFDRYINKCDDIELLDAIDLSITELESITIDEWNSLGDTSYAPGKWSVKDILQHLIDTERIFSYRALVYARGEKQAVLSYDENMYALSANAASRDIPVLIQELKLSHASIKYLFGSFSPDMLSKMCQGFAGEYSVASVGFILPGHQRWHFDVIKETYLPLLLK
jgi:hypothetical protein